MKEKKRAILFEDTKFFMHAKSLATSALGLTLLGLAVAPTSGRRAGGETPLGEALWPFLQKNCVSCHDAKGKAGGLNLLGVREASSVARSRETWESVLRKVEHGEMPPKGSPMPAESARKTAVKAIQSGLERADRLVPPQAGRVTARRLNRVEYNNTVRDLLGVDLRPADDFPQDDSGYGFDNIGDVLSLSPSRMEKYVAAAERLARTALFGPELLAPTLARHEARGRNIALRTDVPAEYDATGLNLPNSLHATHRFPVDGEYVFRFHLNGLRPRGSEALHLALYLDGKRVRATGFDPEGSAAFNPDRQDFSGRTVELRLRVPMGEHWVAATTERLYEGLPPAYNGPAPSKKVVAPAPEFKVRPGIPPEKLAEFKKRFEERQKEKVSTNDVRVSALEIGGPYAQTEKPPEESLRRIFVCGHLHGGHSAACTPKIVAHLARRAFRRPPTAREISKLSGLVALAQKSGDSYEEGIALALQGVLVSPHFLFRIERDPADKKSPAEHALTPHELASRLSYFLWSSMPDEELLTCADKGALQKPEVLKAQVRRMLRSPRSRALAENFAGQWLQFRALESAKPDAKRFPEFDEYLRMSMREETERFFDSVVREDRSALDLLLGKYTFLNERLARFYGVTGVVGPEFRRVDLSGTPRAGILTQASVLTVTSYPNRTSPVLRGKWILENLLNAPPPPAPPGVPALEATKVADGASLRVQLEEHRKNPTCASCHARMDPLGFGLENFDAVGKWRKMDGKVPVDASGSLPDGKTFVGADGLRTVLKTDRAAFARCLTTKLLTYALGRGVERYDRPAVENISQALEKDGYRFSALVEGIVNSKPFQKRKGTALD